MFVSFRTNRLHELPRFHIFRYTVPNPKLEMSRSLLQPLMRHLHFLTPPHSPYLRPRVDARTPITLPPRHLLIQTHDLDLCRHHRRHHPGEYTMSRTHQQIPTKERTTLNHPLPTLRSRKNGYQRKRKRDLQLLGDHLHPPDLFLPFPRNRLLASLLAQAITTV